MQRSDALRLETRRGTELRKVAGMGVRDEGIDMNGGQGGWQCSNTKQHHMGPRSYHGKNLSSICIQIGGGWAFAPALCLALLLPCPTLPLSLVTPVPKNAATSTSTPPGRPAQVTVVRHHHEPVVGAPSGNARYVSVPSLYREVA